MTFDQLLGDAVFCGYRLLLWRWERAAALARSGAERNRLALAADWLRERMEEDLTKKEGMDPAEVAALVLQTAGVDRYTGPLIADRFQVMGSFIGSTYYIVDHRRGDLLVRVAGPVSDVRRFASIKEAEELISSFTVGPIQVIDPPVQQQEMEMPKLVTTTEAPKRGRSPKALAATNGSAKKEAANGSAKKAPKPSDLFKELIMTGKLTDDQIFAKVQEKFGLDNKKRPYVAWYRADLRKKGESPPDARKTK